MSRVRFPCPASERGLGTTHRTGGSVRGCPHEIRGWPPRRVGDLAGSCPLCGAADAGARRRCRLVAPRCVPGPAPLVAAVKQGADELVGHIRLVRQRHLGRGESPDPPERLQAEGPPGAPGRGGGLRWPRFSAAQYRPVLGAVQVVPPRQCLTALPCGGSTWTAPALRRLHGS